MPRQCAEKVRVTFNAHFRGVLYTNGVSVEFCLFTGKVFAGLRDEQAG